MSHDFKHMAYGGPRPVPLWLWLFALIAIAAFVGLLMYLDQYQKGQLTNDHQLNFERILTDLESKSTPKAEIKKPNAPNDSQPKDKKTDFDFYNLLPKLEIKLPSAEQAKQHTQVYQQPTTPVMQPTPGGAQFYLQAGSFKDQSTADRLRAALALLGIESRIEKVTLKDLGDWHRVKVGPFTSLSELEKVRSLMRANNIEPILRRVVG